MSRERRIEVLDICRSNGILVLEDNPYGLLWFDEPAPQAIRSIDDEGVVYLGSFSKTLAPGFRVGWALAPHAIREKLVLANESAVLAPNSFGQYVVNAYLDAADWKGQVDTFRGLYAERRTPCCPPWGSSCPTCRGRSRTAGSSSGSPCPRPSTRRACCRAR